MRTSLWSRAAGIASSFMGLSLLAAIPAGAQFRMCPESPQAGDFTVDVLANRADDLLDEPMHLDFDKTAPGGPDVYFIERAGKVRRIRTATHRVETLGSVNTRATSEIGLLGIALDPEFASNRRLFLYYSSPADSNFMRLSRFTLAGDSLDPKSEKVLLRVPYPGEWYTGGPLLFAPDGNLFVAIGYGMGVGAAAGGKVSADTRDLRGKILRIRPTEAGGYSIPAGNLFPEDRYPSGPGARTRPEIYAMGVKNPFSLGYDPRTSRVAWADMGPDGTIYKPDEQNLASAPGNFGYPYFLGENKPLEAGLGQDPAHPKADWAGNAGLAELPSAQPASLALAQNAPITGSIFRVSALSPGQSSLPTGYDGLWFTTDFNTGRIDTLSLTTEGKVKGSGTFLSNYKLDGPTDLRIGPEGALYVVAYAGWFASTAKTAIVRVRLKDPCVGTTAVAAPRPRALPKGLRVRMSAAGLLAAPGVEDARMRDVTGKVRDGYREVR
ncbi:MAG: hypothetical protein JWP91_4301 [Fibrobacteres bacterium]|nr:hypothetical protein [Fibrobacterota bacterium]